MMAKDSKATVEGADAEAEEAPKRGRGRPPAKVKLVAQRDKCWFGGKRYARGDEVEVDKSEVASVTASGVWKESK